MNKAILLAPVLLMACVSLKEYKAKTEELTALTEVNKASKKEIKDIQKENKALLDTISKRTARATLQSKLLKDRLAANHIKSQISAAAIAGLSIHKPDEDLELAAEMWETYKSRDTNAAKNTTWLSASEQKIYYYLNYARLNPKGFCNKYLVPKLSTYDSTNIYLLTLIDYMFEMKPRNAVVPDRKQFDNAKCHATTSGVLGYVGHERQSKNCKSGFYGECCSYGVSDPLQVVLQLLIDDGVSSLGHRYICLGWYEVCGIAMAPHKGYGTNVVLDFH